MSSLTKFQIIKSLFLGIFIILIGLVAELALPVQKLDSRLGLDSLFYLRGPVKAPREVVVVAIDKVASSFYQFDNDPIDWTRDYHARLINKLKDAGASVIVFDIFFKNERDSEFDTQLANAICDAGNVVLFAKLQREIFNTKGAVPQTTNLANSISVETVHAPTAQLANAALATAPFALPKYPARVTGFWSFRTTAGDAPTMPVLALHQYLSDTLYSKAGYWLRDHNIQPRQSLTEQVRSLRAVLNADMLLADTLLPDTTTHPAPVPLVNLLRMYAGPQHHYLNFYGPPRTINTVTYNQVLEQQLPGGVDAEVYFKNKVVFVGFSEQLEPEQKDNFNTVYTQANGLDVSGVEIAATAFANLLHDTTIKPVSLLMVLLIVVLFGLLIGFISRWFTFYYAIAGWVVVCVSYVWFASSVFNQYATWLPLFTPVLVQAPLALLIGLTWHTYDNFQQRKSLHKAFSYYIPESMVDQLTARNAELQGNQELKYGVCMATDAEQYTQLSESLPPADLARLVNDYYATLFGAVKQYDGVVSDIIGDAMLALWLAEQKDNRTEQVASQVQACLAAVAIRRAADKQYALADKNIILPTRIGMHAGEMMVGNVGAVNHYEYRAVGDIVNTANRIEGLNKVLGTYCLASAAVIDGTNNFLHRFVGAFRLPGKTSALNIYEILSHKDRATDKQITHVQQFESALKEYSQANIVAAEKAFSTICKQYPDDTVAKFYLQLIQQQRTIPIKENWDATIVISKK